MSQSGFTPIQLYRTATASASPTSGNLSDGELAINYNDGKLFYKDSSGVVQTMSDRNATSGLYNINTTNAFTLSQALTGSTNLPLAGLRIYNNAASAVGLEAGLLFNVGNVSSAQYGIYVRQSGTLSGDLIIRRLASVNSSAEVARFDNSGNFGLGATPSSWGSSFRVIELGGTPYISNSSAGAFNLLQNGFVDSLGDTKYKGNGALSRYTMSSGEHIWSTATSGSAGATATVTERMRMNNSGNLLIGTSTDTGYRTLISTTGNHLGLLYSGVATWGFNVDASGNLKTSKDGGERFRISTNGFSKFSNDGNFITGVLDRHEFNSSLNTSLCTFYSSNTGSSVIVVEPALPAGATGVHMACQLNNVRVMQVSANGNILNANNSYGALSDERIKENPLPAKSYLDRFMQVQYKTYNRVGQTHREFGVIAQELEKVFPGLVEEVHVFDKKGKATGEMMKSVKYSILAQIQGKVIQEQQQIIELISQRLRLVEAVL